MSIIKQQVQLLINGVDGKTVVANLRKHYASDASYHKSVSTVRREFLETETRHPEFAKSLDVCRQVIMSNINHTEAARNHRTHQVDQNMTTAATTFLNALASMTMSKQHDTLRRHARTPVVKGFEEFNDAARNIKLVPPNVESLQLTHDDIASSRMLKRDALINKNKRVIAVPNALDLLKTQINTLIFGSRRKADEIIALLFVSGRRESEILNGKSTFVKSERSPYHIYFTGMLKKKSDLNETIHIPLLCKADLFLMALERFQSKQTQDADMNNKEISKRYCSQINAAQKKLLPFLQKPHDLRGVYVKYIDYLYLHEFAMPYLCMQCLGHDVMEDSLHYMSIKLEVENTSLENGYGALDTSNASNDHAQSHTSNESRRETPTRL